MKTFCIILWWAVLGAVVCPMSVLGQDYAPDSYRWDGMSGLMETASEARVQVVYLQELDWAAVEVEDILVILYPEGPFDEEQATAFVDSGGHLVLADDHGASDSFLSGLGIQRVASLGSHTSFLYDDEGFPVLTPSGRHFLFYNLGAAGGTVIANYPSAYQLEGDAQAILTYEDDARAFIAEAFMGEGAVLAIADASLFINEMQRHHGDKQLVANILRYYCRGEPCRVQVVLPSARHIGVFVPPTSEEPPSAARLVLDSVDRFNNLLGDLAGMLASRGGQRVLWAVLTLFVLVGTGVFFALRGDLKRTRWERAPRVAPSLDAQRAAGVLGAWRHAEFVEPLRELAQAVESAVGAQSYKEYETPLQRQELAVRFARQYANDKSDAFMTIKTSVERSLALFETLGGSSRLAVDYHGPISGSVFLEAATESQPMMQAMDQQRKWAGKPITR